MDTTFYRDILYRQAEELSRLADRLSDDGKELDNYDKVTLRHALIPYIRTCHNEAMMFFLEGSSHDYNKSHSSILEIMNDLN